jgi:outer membrane protein assembly factor BamB
MNRHHPSTSWTVGLVTCCLLASNVAVGATDAASLAKDILERTGVQGGIVVHVGCGDGKLTAALLASDRYTVHGLDADSEKVANARRHIQSLGIYGSVSVEQHTSDVLPYADNLINLVVVQDSQMVSMNDVIRVLVPEGVAYVSRDGGWRKIVKARPDNIDQWSHFLHDASNNAVANDSVVGPPRSLQWLAPPLWLRSHETPSGIQSPVSAGGRLFYFFDQGVIGITDERLPEQWVLVCRDAFNGKQLWERPLDVWGWKAWNRQQYEGKDWTTLRGKRTDVPVENQRKIVADNERVYTTLAFGGPMSILDAATGEIISTVKATQGVTEILVSNGVAVTCRQAIPQGFARRRGIKEVGATLLAVDGQTGQARWERSTGSIRPLAIAIQNDRVIYVSGNSLIALGLQDGSELWATQTKGVTPKSVVVVDDVIVMQSSNSVASYDATDGSPLWRKSVHPIRGAEGDDLFVVDGMVWRGMASVDDAGDPANKTPNAMVVGWDLHTGVEKKRIHVNNLRSPEHHHRCYRNKATSRYLISSHEGAEFLDLDGENHGQNNWIRGVCKNGMMPCNGMLYVPPDQCFCEPGAKLLGYAALTSGAQSLPVPPAENERLVQGPAYGGTLLPENNSDDDWPTFRHDPARSGTSRTRVSGNVAVDWEAKLAGKLTAPVAAGGRLFVASSDAHTVYALSMDDGEILWQYTANGRVDSPPTVYRGLVLFGSRDGRVHCLRASDGELVWQFLAAHVDRRVAHFGQLESAWPVHGSVLVEGGVAYFTAGRSTYLDGGIRVYGLDPATGRVLHKGLLEGPHQDVREERDLGFFVLGANSDVLVSEGGFVYMRQKKMTPELKEIGTDVLSDKGAQDVGLHVFSTSGLLDDSWYNRTFWMYSKRWPGFQLANQASKSGQLLVVDDQKTYAVRVYYRRNVHSPMFFPGKEGYLLFADANTNEPQIVGEPGSRSPVRWLPQSDYSRGRGDEVRELSSEAFGLDKMIGYTRAEQPVWTNWLPVRIRAMVKARDILFVAGAPDVLVPEDPFASFEGRAGAQLVAVSADDGAKLSETQLGSPPVFDGMIAADGRLFAALRDGSVVCLNEQEN